MNLGYTICPRSAVAMDRWIGRSRFYVVYGLAHAGKSLFLYASELYFAFFLTEVCGLTTGGMGLLLGGTMAASALTDLPIGVFVRRRIQQASAAALAQLLATAVCAAGFCGFALVGVSTPGPARLWLALGAIALFRVSYSMLDIPQNAIMAFTTSNDRERAQLASVRYIFSSGAGLAVAMAFLPVFKLGAHRAAANFTAFSIAISLIALLSALGLWLELAPTAPSPRPASTGPATPGGQAGEAAPTFWQVAILMFLISATGSIYGRLEPYYAAYGLSSAAQGEAFLTYVSLGLLLSQPGWLVVAGRAGLVGTLRCAALFLMAGSLSFGLLNHWAPGFGGVGALVYGCGSGGVMLALWALAAGVAKRNGQAAATFAAVTCISKLALALAAFAVAALLDVSPYRTRTGALHLILPIMVAVPMLGGLATLVIMSLRRSLISRPSLGRLAT
jgi:Na+/melibiose symporter-like transporter